MTTMEHFQDTIAAIATPIGTAGVSSIRISGPDAWKIGLKLFRTSENKKTLKNFKHSRFYHGWLINPADNSLIDEIILLAFESPKSYTTENLIEIQCHGGISVTNKILELCLDQGCRIAEKGEFTKRAFIGGRIDLTQVEAVLDIISAKTDLFSSVAAYNLSGKLSESINEIRNKLIKLLAHIEASVDFPDEVDEMPYEDLNNTLVTLKDLINEILNKATDGNILKQGIKVAIIGKPNVGKSSLFNYLLKTDRAIVTNIPGTTRDILQEQIEIDGIPVLLTDTAGIREMSPKNDADLIESIGVNRSKGAIEDSDLILFVYDISQGIGTEDATILKNAQVCNKPILSIANKADISDDTNSDNTDTIILSALQGTGIKELKAGIKHTILGEEFQVSRDEAYINIRHKECLKIALKHLDLSIKATQAMEMQDLISIDIKATLLSLNEIVGEVVSEEVLDYIFSQFCIGK